MLLATSLITAHSLFSLSWDEWGSIVMILSAIVAIIHWALNKANVELFVPIYEELKKINEHNKRTDDRQDKIDLRAEEHDKELIHHDEKLADHERRITNLDEETMMKIINDIVYWLISSGALSALFIFAWKYLKPVMIEKQKHAKTMQERELIGLLNQLADNAVNSQVGNAEVTGHDKFKQATSQVGGALADKGFDVKREMVEQAVQAAYEKSDLTPTVDPTQKPQTGVVVHNG